MKELHKIAGHDDLRPSFSYIELKDKYFSVTDTHMLLRIPQEEVFTPEALAQLPEHCYFDSYFWKMSKVSKSETQFVYHDIIKCFDAKGKIIGLLPFITLDEFTLKAGKYPDILNTIPSKDQRKEVSRISLNASLLKIMSDVMGGVQFSLEFNGENKGIVMRFKDSGAIGLVMTMLISQYDHSFN